MPAPGAAAGRRWRPPALRAGAGGGGAALGEPEKSPPCGPRGEREREGERREGSHLAAKDSKTGKKGESSVFLLSLLQETHLPFSSQLF